MNKELLIETKQLQKKYVTDTVETTALAGVDLSITKGEFVAIMGPSGCGKSTLLNILGLLDSPSGGVFKFLGEDITNASERQRAKIRKQNLGFVFQSFNLIDELTVEENIGLPLAYLGVSKAETEKRVMEAMERMGIAHRRNHFPQQLSGGQQQRAAIARATVSNPSLILADEPTGNLDSVHGREVMALLTELNEAGTTVVMVTHSPSDAEYAHRIVNLFDGQIVTENLNVRKHVAELL
ncbi:ABC transporter ATP-binding protein [Pontibacter sp. BT310]|jgi:putative ABC transport system ATP-binding protein|uniref:ABC transporter ATP-binding protein n=1 Tax=Pontibacter populi TaxID=890055 RepID=A0ABS6XCE7_9BACT|nr:MULTISPECIES: ABC transporter ATP-binding protein [Pontibacter]MBJ6118826.1 ABC transporter ATP-binding protein [Pontibacter sp. BT310]MBR0571254.1 ABC transporter ATP-binding protein [Microvirga sp. STS03]MBW3365680.1 ABC transporter ATP-binding protein [Pontibacter populi]